MHSFLFSVSEKFIKNPENKNGMYPLVIVVIAQHQHAQNNLKEIFFTKGVTSKETFFKSKNQLFFAGQRKECNIDDKFLVQKVHTWKKLAKKVLTALQQESHREQWLDLDPSQKSDYAKIRYCYTNFKNKKEYKWPAPPTFFVGKNASRKQELEAEKKWVAEEKRKE